MVDWGFLAGWRETTLIASNQRVSLLAAIAQIRPNCLSLHHPWSPLLPSPTEATTQEELRNLRDKTPPIFKVAYSEWWLPPSDAQQPASGLSCSVPGSLQMATVDPKASWADDASSDEEE